MGHIIHIQSREQMLAAIGVLNELPGMWHGRGTPEAPVLLITDEHFKALIKAGVIPENGKPGIANGKKTTRKKKSKS